MSNAKKKKKNRWKMGNKKSAIILVIQYPWMLRFDSKSPPYFLHLSPCINHIHLFNHHLVFLPKKKKIILWSSFDYKFSNMYSIPRYCDANKQAIYDCVIGYLDLWMRYPNWGQIAYLLNHWRLGSLDMNGFKSIFYYLGPNTEVQLRGWWLK